MARLVAGVGAGLVLGACSSLRYYAHVAHGELDLLGRRRPIAAIVADPAAAPALRERLRRLEAVRAFASDRLDLPRNRSYTSYVELDRPFVTWNVFAAPEFSVEPVMHCFPLAGCVAYRGYFDRAMAEREAARLAKRGDDTAIEGVSAYSTLGWFADPVLSSMLRWNDDELDGEIFHELAHQKLYVKGDSAFNESFATFVQRQGVRQWRAAHHLPAPPAQATASDAAFTRSVLELRERLRALYARDLDPAAMRAAKQREIAAFRERCARRRECGEPRHAEWIAGPINNASLVPFGLYERWVAAFARLFREAADDWPAFYRRAGELARARPAERARRLAALAAAPADLR